MAKAIEVAKLLIQLAAGEDEPDTLTHMRLQKLLYYGQGWSLALRGEPLFNDRIEAWPHGPVVKSVYPAFARFGSDPIPPSEGSEANVTQDEADLVGSVWESLKGHSAYGLRQKTHGEPPWIDARKGLSPTERSDAEITVEAMGKYFKTLVAA